VPSTSNSRQDRTAPQLSDPDTPGENPRREALGLTGIPALVEFLDRPLSLVLPIEPRIDVADQVVSDVVAHVHLEQVAILDQFAVRVLVYVFRSKSERGTGSVTAREGERGREREGRRASQNLSNCSWVSASLN
jgi:hypothetical protein